MGICFKMWKTTQKKSPDIPNWLFTPFVTLKVFACTSSDVGAQTWQAVFIVFSNQFEISGQMSEVQKSLFAMENLLATAARLFVVVFKGEGGVRWHFSWGGFFFQECGHAVWIAFKDRNGYQDRHWIGWVASRNNHVRLLLMHAIGLCVSWAPTAAYNVVSHL